VSRLRFGPVLVAIALAGLGLRVAWILLGDWSPERLVGDAGFFHGVANLIADGQGFVSPENPDRPTALHPPLHPWLLSGFSVLGLTSWTAHRLVGAALGSVTVLLTGLLGRRVGGDRAGLLAAAFAATYPVFVRIDGTVLSESLYGVLIAGCLLASYRLLDRPGPLTALALGGLIGLAALTRAEALLLVVLLGIPVARRAGGRRLLHAGLVCLAVAATLAPWTVRNLIEFDRPVGVATNNGVTIAGANCRGSYEGRDMGLWNFYCLEAARPGENEAEHAERLREKGLTYARDHADRLPLVMLVRTLRTWDLYQPLRQAEFSEGQHIALYRIGLVAFYLLVPLSIAGAVLLRRRGEPLGILLAPVILVILTTTLVIGLPRLRFGAEIPLLVLAGVSLAHLLEGRSAPFRRWPRREARPGTAAPGA
jgi:4-amino-4-deoxy-L-arabinose transferase-like glycosyltransferase